RRARTPIRRATSCARHPPARIRSERRALYTTRRAARPRPSRCPWNWIGGCVNRLMPSVWRSLAVDLACTRCGEIETLGTPHNLRGCGAPLATRYDLDTARVELQRDALRTRRTDLWRYHELLPVRDAAHCITLGEGMTPLLELPRLGAKLGVQLFVKDE